MHDRPLLAAPDNDKGDPVSTNKIVQQITLGARHQRIKSRLLPNHSHADTAAQLAIAERSAQGPYALLYLDRNGLPLGESLHERLALAIGQAEFEYCVAPNEWQPPRAAKQQAFREH